MKINIIKNFYIKLNLDIFLKENLNILFLKSKYSIINIYLPNFYFFKKNKNNLLFCFLKKQVFLIVFKQLQNYYKYYFKFYFFKFKLKGLGYRIKKITNKLYRFFFAFNHFFYFYIPINIYIWKKKRHLLIISIDKIRLNNIFYQLILLKKLDFYERTKSFIIPKKILYIKK